MACIDQGDWKGGKIPDQLDHIYMTYIIFIHTVINKSNNLLLNRRRTCCESCIIPLMSGRQGNSRTTSKLNKELSCLHSTTSTDQC